MFVKGAKFPKWGPYFLGNLARGGQIFGGAKFPVTPVGGTQNKINIIFIFSAIISPPELIQAPL